MNDPENWRWIWLGSAVFFAVSELVSPGTFFMISFAIGAAVACVVAFSGGNVGLEWLAFVVVSGIAVLALVPLGRRLDKGEQPPVGATRFQGMQGTVLRTIPAGPQETGLVRVEREEWRAESSDGREIEAATMVHVIRVDGTRLIVEPLERSQ